MVVGQIARRATHAAADIENLRVRPDPGFPGQDVDRLEAAEVVLIVVLENSLAQTFEGDAIARQIVQDLLLVDRMGLIEVDDPVDVCLQAISPTFVTKLRVTRTARGAA